MTITNTVYRPHLRHKSQSHRKTASWRWILGTWTLWTWWGLVPAMWARPETQRHEKWASCKWSDLSCGNQTQTEHSLMLHICKSMKAKHCVFWKCHYMDLHLPFALLKNWQKTIKLYTKLKQKLILYSSLCPSRHLCLIVSIWTY